VPPHTAGHPPVCTVAYMTLSCQTMAGNVLAANITAHGTRKAVVKPLHANDYVNIYITKSLFCGFDIP